jgi:tRNA 2-selenouridine synthase
MMNYIDAEQFLDLKATCTMVDVRSPSEFKQGHIPGAVNIPLFDDEERKIVGTLYKNSGKEAAVLKGLELVGPKMPQLVRDAKRLVRGHTLLIHCWRGGLRSRNMAFLFETAGYDVHILDGGYKAYRSYVRSRWNKPVHYLVVGGKTGSGKSDVLMKLRAEGEQVLDLEGIAHHRGSAFGDLGQPDQPTNEQFENNLFDAWNSLNPEKTVWIEDESRGIGRVSLPEQLFNQIRRAPVIFLDVDKKERIQRLVDEYGSFDPPKLEAAIHRIAKKLGGLNEKKAIEALKKNDFTTVADLLLIYYDKAYLKGLSLRDPERIFHFPCSPVKDRQMVTTLRLKFATQQHSVHH